MKWMAWSAATVSACVVAAVLAFLAGLASTASLFGGGTSGLFSTWLLVAAVAAIVFVGVLLGSGGTSTMSSRLGFQLPPAPPVMIQPATPPGILGFWGRLRYDHDYGRDVASRTLVDLEGETNRRAVDLLTKGIVARDAWTLGQLLAQRRSITRTDSVKQLIDRAIAIQAIEYSYELPNPLDTHGFLSSRLDAHRKELDRRYGLDAGSHPTDLES